MVKVRRSKLMQILRPVLIAAAISFLTVSLAGSRQVFGQAGPGEPDPSEYEGGDGTSCEVDPGCNGDPCCEDPQCCGDPCCGDPCCEDPECCSDPCCNDPGHCEQTCYDYCLESCGDNETCMPGYEDPETHECYAFESDFCCEWVTYCF